MSERLERGKNWPQEFGSSEPQYGLFRKPFAAKPPASQKWRNKRPGMSEEHLALIRKLPCTVCHVRPCDAHHLKSNAARLERGMSLRATDRWAVPLCRFHHEDLERIGSRNEESWFGSRGINACELALALWNSTGELSRMALILIAHKQLAIRTLRKEAAVGALMRHGLTRAEAEEQYTAGLIKS